MINLESYKMTALWPNDSLSFPFYEIFSNRIQNWASFVKKVFYLMISLETDEMTALWQNGHLTFTFWLI